MNDWRNHDTSKCGPFCKLCRAIDVVDGLNAEYSALTNKRDELLTKLDVALEGINRAGALALQRASHESIREELARTKEALND